MKKFLMYVIVLVAMLFVGYTTYYFVRNNENIYLTLAEEDRTIYMNVDESYDLPIVWTKPYSSTKVYENVVVDNEAVVTFDVASKKFVAKTGGTCRVTITPSNKKFGPFMFTVAVGDGTILNPYFLRNDEDLLNVGKGEGEKWQLSNSYKLTTDIDLRSQKDGFAPIGTAEEPFSGTFDGNGHMISNVTIKTGANAGLFGVLTPSAVVSNLNMEKVVLDGEFDNAGAVAGLSRGTLRSVRVSNVTIKNTKADSNNGGLVGRSANYSSNNEFVSFGYIDMCYAKDVTAKVAGNFGGLVGNLTGSILYNSYADIKSYTEEENSAYFGGLVGVLQNAEGTTSYMFSVVKNCYTLIGTVTLAEESAVKVGTVCGKNVDLTTETSSNKVLGLYTHTQGVQLPVVGEDAAALVTADVHEKANTSDLKYKATFVGYNFEEVWTIEEGDTIADLLPFDEVISQPLGVYIPGQKIEDLDDLLDVLEGVETNPGSGKTFEITNNIVYDLNGAEWNTIAPNQENPLTCSFICEEGVTVTIKNFKLTNANNSVFGYISGQNTTIKGFIFENVTENSNEEIVAVVATALLNEATLENIEVKNANITTGDNNRYLGTVVGINNGKVLGAKVNSGAVDQNTLSSSSANLVVGGIVADNRRVMQNSTIEMYNFDITSTSTTSTLKLGGVAGVNGTEGNIKNCYNFDAGVELSYYGEVYAGGVVGYADGGKIVKCFSEAKVIFPYTNEKSYVGGVAAYAGVGSVKQCYYSSNILQGYNVAGIVQTSNAEVDQCYFQGEAKGNRVAGVVGINNKTVTNCSVLGTLEGMSSNAKVSGVVSYLPKGSLVDHCFSTATFKGLGQHHAETESEFRATIEKAMQIFDMYPDTGEFKNTIIINYGNAAVKVTWVAAKPGWIDCTNAQAKGVEGNYSVFTDKAGFDQTIWTFDNHDGEGAYPTLTYVVVNPNAVNTDEEI